jgi:hypothetical protein
MDGTHRERHSAAARSPGVPIVYRSRHEREYTAGRSDPCWLKLAGKK